MYDYLENILTKLHINNPKKVKYMLVSADNTYFGKHKLNNMIGGTHDDKFKVTLDFDYNKYTFVVYQVNEDDRISFSVHNKNDDSKDSCVVIFYDKSGKFCYIESISAHSKCFVGTDYTKKGTVLLKFAIEFIKRHISKKHKVKYIQLKDNSVKYCKSIEQSIDLDSFYMLLYANTWYGKYGFVPFDNSLISTNELWLRDYKHNQKIVNKILVKDIKIAEYINKAIKKLKLKISNVDTYVKKYNDKLLMIFLRKFLDNYDRSCSVFFHIYKQLMMDLGMIDMHGRSYWMKL